MDFIEDNHQATNNAIRNGKYNICTINNLYNEDFSRFRIDKLLSTVEDDNLNYISSDSANALVREVADETRSTVADDDKLLKDALDTFEACIALGNAALSASDKSTAAAEALTDIIEVDIVELLAGRPALRGAAAAAAIAQQIIDARAAAAAAAAASD